MDIEEISDEEVSSVRQYECVLGLRLGELWAVTVRVTVPHTRLCGQDADSLDEFYYEEDVEFDDDEDDELTPDQKRVALKMICRHMNAAGIDCRKKPKTRRRKGS